MLWSKKRTRFEFRYCYDILLSTHFQVLRAQLELAQVKQEIDRRIAEKEEEFENTRFDANTYINDDHMSMSFQF